MFSIIPPLQIAAALPSATIELTIAPVEAWGAFLGFVAASAAALWLLSKTFAGGLCAPRKPLGPPPRIHDAGERRRGGPIGPTPQQVAA